MPDNELDNKNAGTLTPPAPTPSAPPVNYEDLIAKARAEEKQKVYGEIEKLKEDKAKLTERVNQLVLQLGEKEEAIKAVEKDVADKDKQIDTLTKEGTKNMDKATKDLSEKVAELEKQLAVKDAEITQIKNQVEIDKYVAEKTKDLDEDFRDMVVGSTKEEIDASYEKAKAKYDKIASKFATTTKEDTPLIPKVPTNVNEAFKNIKPEDIANMSAKEWKEHRKTLGLK
jgi:chromosome segregation ATPase